MDQDTNRKEKETAPFSTKESILEALEELKDEAFCMTIPIGGSYEE